MRDGSVSRSGSLESTVEELSQEISVPIDIVGMRDVPKGRRFELFPGMTGDPAKRIIDLKAATIQVDESHADRRTREGALEARLYFMQAHLGDVPLLLQSFAIGDLAEQFGVGSREQSLSFLVLAELSLDVGQGRRLQVGAPEGVRLKHYRGSAHHLAKTSEPTPDLRDPPAATLTQLLGQRLPGDGNIPDPGSDVLLQLQPGAGDRFFELTHRHNLRGEEFSSGPGSSIKVF